jgi:hypothetical protein
LLKKKKKKSFHTITHPLVIQPIVSFRPAQPNTRRHLPMTHADGEACEMRERNTLPHKSEIECQSDLENLQTLCLW